ncbi:hypothetical protein [Cyanobium sp. NIES-981]|uniref:hypothetical protein n=1 Tax=Cyanobium sp. NIES-981 TaxID=1851505 RepID=UPI0007DDDC59|nr:hypothetical protein [Cyanobium sp. NIES-981]SBO42968.1 conserved protein of unknown function [Cyanobium sp. NIES-981]
MTALFCTTATTTPSQGECVLLDSGEQLYQVIGVDDRHDRCWLRRWPLARHGSEVFEISLQRVRPARPHRS